MPDENRTIFNEAKEFLLRIFNREFIIFTLFLGISCAFWLVTVLNDNMEREFGVEIRLINIPKDVILTSDSIDTVRVVVRDKGFAIAQYEYGDILKPIIVDFKTLKHSDDNGTITNSELQKLITKMLKSSTHIVQMKPEKLTYYFSQGLGKKVPVRFDGTLTAATSYYISDTKMDPDSVMIYGPQILLDRIQAITTVKTTITGIEKDLYQEIALLQPEGIKVVPAKVSLQASVDILTEGVVEVPIKTVNVPEGMFLKTFPARVKISFVVTTANFRNVKPEQFSVEIDYNDIAKDPERKTCPLILRLSPVSALHPQMSISEVEYLIER